MSIFKVKKWWSNESLQNVESTEGIQNGGCLKVDKFNSHGDSDCVVVGHGNLLQVYKPNGEEAPHALIEMQVNSPILQVETGKFIVGAEDRQVLLLHPQSYVIYQLLRKEGHTDVGEQNILELILKHSFTRRAHSVTCGQFGNIKTRDLICIQGLDGSLSFFDQDTFVFMYIFEDIIIPGPVKYISSSDAFVISKSTWELEIYSYHQLREFSELKAIQNKKNIPQWVYQAGEEISSVQIIQTSNNFSSVVALGERHLYCFQDNGLMKHMIKFDFIPVCFHAYLIGWYYEPTARLLIMVVSDDSKFYVYERTTLLWSCALLQPAIAIARCFLKHLPGGIVALSPTGVITVNYLGTEPDLNSNAAPMISDVSTADIQTELQKVEESLKIVLDGDEGKGDGHCANVEQIVEIKEDVGKPVQNLFEQFTSNTSNETLHLLMCPLVSIMKCNKPQQIQSVQITYTCNAPFVVSEPTISLDNLNGTEIIETQVFLTSKVDIPDTRLKILYTLIDSTGKISVLTREVELPIALYCNPVPIVEENELKLRIELNKPSISFHEIFTDFTKEELFKDGNLDIISLEYRTTERTVTMRTESEGYLIEANDIADFTAILGSFIMKLANHFTRINVTDFYLSLKYDEDFMKLMMYRFLKSIETHANERTRLKTLEEELKVLHRQFTVVQKRLLVQYGSSPPGDCDALEFLMKDTHKRLVKSVEDIIVSRELVLRASSTLTSIGRLVMYVLKINVKDEFKVKLTEEMMTLNSLNEHFQEWQESVTQALYYILNNVFYKTEKDKEKLAPVTEQGVLAHVNLKRFIKQIRIVLDRMLSEGRDDSHDTDTQNVKEKKLLRIEEFVEVI